MKRRKEREFALKLLYANEYNPLPLSEHLALLRGKEPEMATDFPYELAEKCLQNTEKLDELLKSKLQHWDFTRIATIDRILIRLALTEFLYFEDIPPEVTMDEIIEIGKAFSTEKSGKFINGLLDALLKHLQDEKLINKSGRGLVSNVLH